MLISNKLVRKFQEIYWHKFGEAISTKRAEQELFNLAELVRLILTERRSRHDS